MATGIKDKVAIIGMGCSKFGERWDCGTEHLMSEAFQEALTSVPAPATQGARVVPGHGLLSAEHRAELRASVLRELVAPSIPSLLAA